MNEIILGDCRRVMREMEEKSIDLTVTSPPYDNLRTYNNSSTWNFDIFKEIANELYRITKDGGVVVWVVGDATINGSETGTSFRQALYFMEIGFNLHDTMIYQKNSYPFPPSNRYFPVFEYMFILVKGELKTFNLLKVPTIWRKGSSQTARQKDGSTESMKYAVGRETRIKDNVWVYECGYGKSTTDKDSFEHPAIFPEALARDHIISWSNEGDTVLDPFCGSGTTCKMAYDLKRNYIGIEIDETYHKLATKRVEDFKAQQRLF